MEILDSGLMVGLLFLVEMACCLQKAREEVRASGSEEAHGAGKLSLWWWLRKQHVLYLVSHTCFYTFYMLHVFMQCQKQLKQTNKQTKVPPNKNSTLRNVWC